jgi:hypothetical protein
MRKVAMRIHTVKEFAPRDVRMSCAAIRPMPRNAMPVVPVTTPMTTEPCASTLEAMSARVTSTASTTLAPTPWMIVATVGCERPVGVAATSSVRPASSSPRVWRTARNVLMSAASIVSQGRISKAMNWPSDAPDGRPRNIMITGFAITAASTSTRSACVPYDCVTPA